MLRIVVTANGGGGDGLAGVAQKQVFVHDDPDLVGGYPRRVESASAAQPVFEDLDGRPGDELILATDDGVVHAYDARGRDILGWPVRTTDAPWWPTGSRTALESRIAVPGTRHRVPARRSSPISTATARRKSSSATPTATSGRGRRTGVAVRDSRRPRSRVANVRPRTSTSRSHATAPRRRTSSIARSTGSPSAPAAADLDGDGRLEIVAAALDRHVYAWHDDGRTVAGFPVLAVDPAKVAAVDATSHHVTFTPDSGVREGGELIVTPTLVDLTGDGLPEIVVGGQEEYEEPPNIGDGAAALALLGAVSDLGNSRLYAISSTGRNATFPDRSPAHPDDNAYVPGWPVALGQLGLEVLPTIGDGVAMQAAAGDVHPQPGCRDRRGFGRGAAVRPRRGGPFRVRRFRWPRDPGGVVGRDRGRNRVAFRCATQHLRHRRVGSRVLRLRDRRRRRRRRAPGVRGADAWGSRDCSTSRHPISSCPTTTNSSAGRAQSGDALPGFPQVTSDMAFFVAPAIADLDGNGKNEVVAGNGVYMLGAHDRDGVRPDGWPKLTGGWLVGTPGLGDWDGDGRAELAVTRRDGVLLVWHTNGAAGALTEWPRARRRTRATPARPTI